MTNRTLCCAIDMPPMFLEYEPDQFDVTISELLVATSDSADPGTLCCFSRNVRTEVDFDRLRYTASLIASRMARAPRS